MAFSPEDDSRPLKKCGKAKNQPTSWGLFMIGFTALHLNMYRYILETYYDQGSFSEIGPRLCHASPLSSILLDSCWPRLQRLDIFQLVLVELCDLVLSCLHQVEANEGLDICGGALQEGMCFEDRVAAEQSEMDPEVAQDLGMIDSEVTAE